MGIVVVNLLIVTNVMHNTIVSAPFLPRGDWAALPAINPLLMAQIAFMLFVLATTRTAWIGARPGAA